MRSRNNHKRLIPLLRKLTCGNALEVLWAVAEKHPAALLSVLDAATLSKEAELREMVLRAPDKVSAIKGWRNITGASLYDAKEAVEAIRKF